MSLTRVQFQNINTNLTAFSDPITVTNFGNIGNRDIGEIFDRSQGSASNVAIIWQESTKAFRLGYTSDTGKVAANITFTGNANLRVGNLYAESISWANGAAFTSSSPGVGTSGQLQYNNAGQFGSASGLTTDGSGTLNAVTVQAATIGNVGSLHIGTIQTNAQPNITSVGTLTGLTLSGTLTGTSINAGSIGNVGSSLTGTLQTASQTNITSVGTLTGLSLSGNLNGTSINAGSIGNVGTSLTGTLQTAAQTNITSVGTLTGLSLSGTLNGTTLQASTIGNVGAGLIGANVTATNSLQGPVGVYGANTGSFSTITTTGNATASALTVNGAATVGSTLSASGGIQNTAIGNLSQNSGTFTSLQAYAGLNNTIIGNATAASASFTQANINSSSGMYNILNITGTALAPYGGSQTWKFFTQNAVSGGPGSWILFPDSSYQYTAYPGTNLSGVTALTLSGNVTAAGLTVNANAAISGNISANNYIIGGTGIFWANGTQFTSGSGGTVTYNPSIYNGLVTTVNTSPTLIDSISVTGNSSVTYTLTAIDNTNSRFKSSKLETVNDGVNVYFTEYGVVRSNTSFNVAVITSNISGGQLQVYAQGDSANTYVSFQRVVLGSSTTAGYVNTTAFVPNASTTVSNLTATGNTVSTSSTTGTLTVTGGAGISGNIYTANLVVGTGTAANGQVPGLVAGSAAYVTIMGARLGDTGSQVTGVGALELQGGSGSGNGLQSKIDFVSKSTGNILYNTARISVTNTSADTASGIMLFGTRNGSSGSIINSMTLTEQGNLTVIGGLQNTPIGNVTPSTGVFTTVNVTSTTANAITANFTHAADPSFQLTSQNGVGTNNTGDEVARFGINYVTAGWDSFTKYIRGSGAQNGSQILFAGNTAQFTVASTGVTVVGTSALNGNVNTNNIFPFGNANANIGSSALQFNTVFAKATSAQYADLAENYQTDIYYAPGTVLIFGGEQEVTLSTRAMDRRVAGVVSTNPAYLMNSNLDNSVSVALTGRVPCFVVGVITKGDMLVSSNIPGVATSATEPALGSVIGKALQNYNSNEVGTIEVVVGRL